MVKPKKHLGQHFLKDESIAKRIAESLTEEGYDKVVEVGPGTGALTKHILQQTSCNISLFEVDRESIAYLQKNMPQVADHIYQQDFLQADFSKPPFGETWKGAIAGNFPYNISSQILFKVFENKDKVIEVVGMFQKEVAERIAAGPGTKKYGILSVLLQAFYNIEYLFTVPPSAFFPPPKVDSGVIRLMRNEVAQLACDEVKFKKVVKTAFNQRRKTLRNALKSMFDVSQVESGLLGKRAEQLSVEEFVAVTRLVR